jgi:hypothetical protein
MGKESTVRSSSGQARLMMRQRNRRSKCYRRRLSGKVGRMSQSRLPLQSRSKFALSKQASKPAEYAEPRDMLLTRSLRTPLPSIRRMSTLLVSPKQAAERLREGAIPLDASWHMPNSPRNARAEFQSGRLPSARFWDQDAVAAPNDLNLPHMLPSAEHFASACSSLGISRTSDVILYDSVGLFSAPRALWTFRVFGHERVHLLNGGLQRWVAEGYSLASEEADIKVGFKRLSNVRHCHSSLPLTTSQRRSRTLLSHTRRCWRTQNRSIRQ